MKILPYIFLPIVIFAGCTGYSQKASEVVRIEFTSLSRGGYMNRIEITKDSLVHAITEGRGADPQTKRKRINSKDWELLIQSLNHVPLEELPNLPSPTMKRAYDGARHSTLSFTTSKEVVLSHSFDDEEPNEKLQQLMKVINELIK